MSLALVKSDISETERQNAEVWEKVDEHITDALAQFKEQFTQETLGPFVAAYESRIRKLEEQIPLLALLQGQQTIIGLLMKERTERE